MISKENRMGSAVYGGLGKGDDVEVRRRDVLLKCFELVLQRCL